MRRAIIAFDGGGLLEVGLNPQEAREREKTNWQRLISDPTRGWKLRKTKSEKNAVVSKLMEGHTVAWFFKSKGWFYHLT